MDTGVHALGGLATGNLTTLACTLTDDVLAVDRMQLYDILRVECVYNADKKELLISGLFGDAIVLDMRKSSS
jgi:hypothetical protein